jgi:Transposase DDE domain
LDSCTGGRGLSSNWTENRVKAERYGQRNTAVKRGVVDVKASVRIIGPDFATGAVLPKRADEQGVCRSSVAASARIFCLLKQDRRFLVSHHSSSPSCSRRNSGDHCRIRSTTPAHRGRSDEWPIGQDDRAWWRSWFRRDKRVKGRKRHILVDTLRLLVANRVETADTSDRRAGALLLGGLSPLFPRIRTIIADAGHESRKLARILKQRQGWQLRIVKRRQRAFKITGLTWIVERSLALPGSEGTVD